MAKYIKPQKSDKNFAKGLANTSSISNLSSTFNLSFKHLDKTQGQTFEDWEREKILARALDTLQGYCTKKLNEQLNSKFTIYNDFPPKEKTDFKHPRHVPLDAKWARIHITGKQVVAGHIYQDTFFVVFLDKEHKFYKSEKKHT